MSDITHIMADHGIIPADTRQLRTSNEPAASALSRIPNATGRGQDSEELVGLAMGGRIEREAAVHALKIDVQPMTDLLSGDKTGEVRRDDRGFAVGDAVNLTCADGRTATRRITHIQHGYGLPDDLCVLSYARATPAARFTTDHSGDANKKVAALIQRMEWACAPFHGDAPIRNCDLGQITVGDVRDLCDAVRTIPAVQDRGEVELVTDADKLRSPATGMSRDSRGAADAYRQGLVTARVIVSRRALELDAEGYPESKMKASVLANVANEISAIIDLALAAGPTLPPMMEVDHIVRNAQDEKRAALRANDALTAERDALKAEVEELRMALQAEIMFSDFVAAKFRVNPDKLCLTVHVRPDGQEVATDRKPDGSEAASITWAEVHAGSRIALHGEQKGDA